MTITISLQELLVGVLLLLAIVALTYLIVLLAKLMPGVKLMVKVLEDASVLSGQARESMESVQGIIGNVTESVSDISGIIAGNKSNVKALANIVNALAGLVKLLKNKA